MGVEWGGVWGRGAGGSYQEVEGSWERPPSCLCSSAASPLPFLSAGTRKPTEFKEAGKQRKGEERGELWRRRMGVLSEAGGEEEEEESTSCEKKTPAVRSYLRGDELLHPADALPQKSHWRRKSKWEELRSETGLVKSRTFVDKYETSSRLSTRWRHPYVTHILCAVTLKRSRWDCHL